MRKEFLKYLEEQQGKDYVLDNGYNYFKLKDIVFYEE